MAKLSTEIDLDALASAAAALESKQQCNLYLKRINTEFIDKYAQGHGLSRSTLVDAILDAIRLASVKSEQPTQ